MCSKSSFLGIRGEFRQPKDLKKIQLKIDGIEQNKSTNYNDQPPEITYNM